MSSHRDHLFILVSTAPLSGSDGRALAAVQGLERAFPGVRLDWEVAPDGRPVALPRRDEWLAAAVARGSFPLLCNGDETAPVTMVGHDIPAELAPGGRPLLNVHAELPLDARTVAVAAGVLEGVADGACALWGQATPGRAAVEIAEQTIHPAVHPFVTQSSPRGLPALQRPDALRAPEIPHHLGWLNYWSAASAALLGFPDPARDASLFARARRTVAGAWLLQLTDEPLDLDDPAHLDALKAVYHRFPEIGGRSLP